MSNKNNSDENKVLLIVGGAFNYVEQEPKQEESNPVARVTKLGWRLLEQSYSIANKGVYRSIGSVASRSELIIPSFFGVFKLEETYLEVESETLDRMSDYPDGTKFCMAGFSLGGDMVARFESLHPDLIESSLSIAGAHLGSRVYGFGPKHFKPFLDKTADIRRDVGRDGPPISFIGSRFDNLIPLNSSLPDLPFVSKEKDQRIIGSLGTNHLSIAWHHDTVEACRQMVDSSVR